MFYIRLFKNDNKTNDNNLFMATVILLYKKK